MIWKILWRILPVTCLFSIAVLANEPSNRQVEGEVEEITSDPAYRWLKHGAQRKETSGQVSGEYAGKPANSEGRFQRGQDDCGYSPQMEDAGEGQEPGGGCSREEGGGCSWDLGQADCSWLPSMEGCSCGPIGQGLGMLGGALGYVLAGALLLVLIFFVVKTLLDVKDRKDSSSRLNDSLATGDNMEVGAAAVVDPDVFMSRAKEAAVGGDYKKAVGYCYMASLSLIGRSGLVDLDRSLTNRRIVAMVKKRGGPAEALRELVGHFEDLYFGNRQPLEAAWLRSCEIVNGDMMYLKEHRTIVGHGGEE